MKSFIMVHDNKPKHVVELSFFDMVRLLLGKEIVVHDIFVIRSRLSFEMFNLNAPRAE